MTPWKESEDEIFEVLLKESKDAWVTEPDTELLRKISSRMAEGKYKLAMAESDGNEDLATYYRRNINLVSSHMEFEFEDRSPSFSSRGATLLTKIINKIAKELVKKAVLPSLKDLPSEEKESIEKEIEQVFDKAVSEKDTTSKEDLMAKLSVEEVAKKLEPIIKKVTEDGDYMKAAMEGVMLAMGLVNHVSEMTGEEKKAFVIESFRYAYKAFDPDIPYIDGVTEEIVETYFLKQLLPAAIDALYAAASKGLPASEEKSAK